MKDAYIKDTGIFKAYSNITKKNKSVNVITKITFCSTNKHVGQGCLVVKKIMYRGTEYLYCIKVAKYPYQEFITSEPCGVQKRNQLKSTWLDKGNLFSDPHVFQ